MPIDDEVATPSALLAEALQSLHARSGAPSVRALAQQIGSVSHTTVADALAGRRVPSWQTLAGIVRALGGEQERFRQLWLDARAGGVRSNAAATTSDRQDDDFAARYVRQIMSHTDWLVLQDSGGGSRVAFDELYIPQRVVAAPGEEHLDLGKLGDQLRRVLLLGDHGIGLSTACRALMRRHAIERTQEVPFLIQVPEFAVTLPPARSVVGHIEHATETFFQVRPPEGGLTRLLAAGRALVIFDGLADVAPTAASAVVSIIELFCREFPEARVLVTAYPADAQAWLDLGIFAGYRLAGFTPDQVADYVRRWFTLAPGVPDEDRQRLAQELLDQSGQPLAMAANPLRVRLACQAYAGRRVIPADLSLTAPGDHLDSLATAGSGNLPSASSSSRSASTARTGRILVVDDERDWLELIVRTLPDHEVDGASSYGQALELINSGRSYDLAIVDLNLMDSGKVDTRDRLGGGLLDLLRDNYPATRRIAMTGWPLTSVRQVFDRFDVDELLLKQRMALADIRHVVEHTLALGRSQASGPSQPNPQGRGAV